MNAIPPRYAEECAKIPGLKVLGSQGVKGSLDAVAAAFRVCREAAPVEPSMPVTQHPHLRPYQSYGVERMWQILQRAGGVLLSDDMGLGKTRQAATLAAQIGGRMLVVCPAAVRETWRAELARIGVPDEQVAILGPPSTKAYAPEWERYGAAQYVVTSYELADRVTGVYTTLIADEMHRVKGREYRGKGPKHAAVLQDIAAVATYKIGITGTPVMDRPRDLYRVLRILFGNAFGSSWVFDHRYCGAHLNEWGGLDNKGATNTDELKLRLSYLMVRRTKQQVAAELPAVTRQVLWLDPSEKGTLAFQRAMLMKKKGQVQAALTATLEAKMSVAVQLAIDSKRFLLLTYKREHARSMADKISRETPCYCITGEDTHEQRAAIIRMAAASGAGIVATMDSIGTGVDGLQHVASYGIFHALDWQFEKMAQCEARLDRIGQTLPVTWVYLAERESMDAIVARVALEKADQANAVLGGSRDQRNALSDATNDPAGEEAALAQLYAEMEAR